MNKIFFLIFFLIFNFNLNAEENMMILKLKDGDVKIELFEDKAPNHVKRIKELADKGLYDNVVFHRVIDGFMAQGGCPNTREGASGIAGTGGPGYQINCEINDNKHIKGSLSMAHAGKDTGGSQFFIVHEPQPHLDGVHTVFGQTEDYDILFAIKQGTIIKSIDIVPHS